MYSVVISNKAEKQLKKLSKDLQLRVISSIKRCRIRPHPHVTKLIGSPYFRLRVGDYRVILDIKENTLFIIEISHRKNIYKK